MLTSGVIAIINIVDISNIVAIILHYFYNAGWLETVGSRIVYELDYRKSVLNVLLIQTILKNCQLYPSVILGLFCSNS